ncbi:MAG: thiol reductant ABC exporter subunit CydC [Acidimicrobiales bacterium]
MSQSTATGERAPLVATLRVARPAAARVALASLLGAGAVAAGIGLIAAAAWLISRASQHPYESSLGLAIVAVQFFGLSRGFFRYGERLVGHDAAFRVLADLRVRVYVRLEALAPTGLPAFRSGDLLARLVQDVDAFQDLIVRVIPPFAVAAVVGAATVAFIWWILPAAGLILLVCLVLSATAVPWLTGALARRAEGSQAAARGQLASSVLDLIDGAPDLVAYGAMGAQLGAIERTDAELTAQASASATTTGIGQALTIGLTGLAMWGNLVVGILAVRSGRMPGVFLAVVALVPLAAFELVTGLPGATQALQHVRRSAARVFAVLEADDPVVDPDRPVPVPSPPLTVATAHLGATYPGAEAPALVDVDLVLGPGRRVALVGPSGAGKSSLAAVLARFLAYRGSANLGGTELCSMDGDAVRSVIGTVTQDAHLFDTTLAENLRIGAKGATDADLAAVVERVGLSRWVAGLPDGLGTEVGDAGARLSGGQRQRVAVARALLADFPVLILDEPAEHLDPVAADRLTADLLDLSRGRSTLLITHRLAGLEALDEIIVLEAGRVVERGSHDALLAAGERYARLWRRETETNEEDVLCRVT